MRLLTGANDVIRITTGSAATIGYVIDYMTTDNASPPAIQSLTSYPPSVGVYSSAGTTTVLSAPESGRAFNVKTMSFCNEHASQSTTLKVDRYDGANARQLWYGTLLAGETLIMNELGEWSVMTASGLVKSGSTLLDVVLRVASDVTNSLTSFADVTGLTYPLLSGRAYAYEINLFHQTAATTTGAQFGVNIGATPTLLTGVAIQQITSSVTAATFGASAMISAVDTAFVVETTGPGANNFLAYAKGLIIPSADGTFAARFKSEVASSNCVVKAGSWMRIKECSN